MGIFHAGYWIGIIDAVLLQPGNLMGFWEVDYVVRIK